MDYEPAIFRDVPYGTVMASPCSPQIVDPSFRGIAIRVPARIAARPNEELVVPICGYYVLPTAEAVTAGGMQVHMRNLADPSRPPFEVSVTGGRQRNVPADPPPQGSRPIDVRRFAGQISKSYFNLDIQQFMEQPLPPGTYDIVVSYGRAQSNVGRIEIAVR